jgi:phosphoribosylformylglycinamidine cyclo-ligase
LESTYKNAGVNISAGEDTVNRIKQLAKATFNKNVLGSIGNFGSFFELDLSKYQKPVLVSSVDGVGTKLKIAFQLDKHNTIGQDLVNHCVNDIAVCGADPLYFLDYLAFGKLVPGKAALIIEGFSKACKKNGVALVGGETAEMPGFYAENEYDISGTIVGVVEKSKIINGSTIAPGDVLIGFESNGLHTNGYSLARKVLLNKYQLSDKVASLQHKLGFELLRIHKSYLELIRRLKKELNIKAFSHITGGGILGNTNRVIPKGIKLKVDWNSWETPSIFKLIQQTGKISDKEMRKVFNMGIGLIAIVDTKNVERVFEISNKLDEKAFLIGKTE